MDKLLEKTYDILFVNLEVVRQENNLNELEMFKIKNWNETYKKSSFFNETFKDESDAYEQRGSLYAEYGKIIALHMAYFNKEDGKTKLHSKVFTGDEKNILMDFIKTAPSFDKLCSYDGKRFDFPYLIKRLLINKLPIPQVLKTQGKKPWEILNIETLELWQNGNSYYSPLSLVANSLGIDFTTHLNGDAVSEAYFSGPVSDIYLKCQEEGIANVKVWLKLAHDYDLEDDTILKI